MPGQRIVATDPPAPGAPNWRAVGLPLPSDVQPSPTRALLDLGVALSATDILLEHHEPKVLLDPSLSPVVDTFTSYKAEDADGLKGVYSAPWAPFAAPVLVGKDPTLPAGLFARLNAGTSKGLHVVTRDDTAGSLDGTWELVFKHDGGPLTNIWLLGRASGTPGKETGVGLQLSPTGLTLVTVVSGVVSPNLDEQGAPLVCPIKLTTGPLYRASLALAGRKVRAKFRSAGAPDPGWQVRGVQGAVLTPGKVAAGLEAGYVKVVRLGLSRSLDLPLGA